MINSIVLIGGGNVAHHISLIFEQEELPLEAIYTRDGHQVGNTDSASDLSSLPQADLYILAVADGAIAEVSTLLAEHHAQHNPLVVHTSGSISTLDIDERFERRGVWYPLQTFSKSRAADWKTVPMCVTARNRHDANLLFSLAREVSRDVQYVSDESRAALHIAAVMVNNMTNHVLDLAGDIVTSESLDPDLLKPLLNETLSKLSSMSARKAQTGPARRGDQVVIDKHLAYLKAELPHLAPVYEALSTSLIRRFQD